MSTRARAHPVVALVVAATAALGACDSGESEDQVSGAVESTEAPSLSVTIPAERLTPFCQAMIDLTDRLVNDPPADPEAEIIAAYESIVDDVPAEIRTDFLTVLARLQGGAPITTAGTVPATAPASTAVSGSAVTTVPFFEEGYDPDDDPALRVNQYVQFACRDSINNPGPAATEPGETVAP